ncbi:MAG: carboxypeptidase regulatory-like domain-containing protein, partial [Bryobacteraceae bacterium]
MSRVRSFQAALLVLAVLFYSAAVVYAQSDTSQISGFVRDASGAVVPNADVTVRNEATNAERRATSNESGYYVIPNLTPGFYTVIVEAEGFKRYEKTTNKLDANLATTVNADLQVGQVTETVEVTAEIGQVQAETATVGRTVEATQIERLMLNGRNPINLALLKAGVRTDGSIARFSFGLTSGNYAINGARSQDSTIFMDGAVATRTRANGTSIGAADVDTVQEVQILTANYNAEYGRSGGGQIRMVTKSGTSDFHGSAYEYFRNSALDANSWSRNRAGLPNEAYRFNQFGYVFSGPVFIPGKFNTDRNKLFFLWSQEWVRYRRESTSIETVPSMAMRSGDFSELLNASNPFFGRVRTVNDPETGQPFPGNIIPANRLSENGLAFLNAIPEPTPGFLQGRNNFIQTRPNPQDQRKDTASVDFVPTLNHTIRARWQNYNWKAVDAFRGGFDRAVTDWDRPNMTSSVNHIWTISPTTINEFVVTASVDRVYINIDREGGRYERSRYGINYPYIFPERKEIFDKIPTIAISNFTQLDGGPYPSSSTGPIYTISNSTTKILNNHTLKWGVFFERSGQNDFDQINVTGVPGGTNNQNGRFVFDDTRQGAPSTGLAVGNAAMGLFTTYAEIGQRSYTPYRGHMFEWFLQDSWRVNQKLRLELGLRHTILQPYYSLWRNMAAFDSKYYDPSKEAVLDPSTGFIISTGDRFNGIVIPGEGWPDSAQG